MLYCQAEVFSPEPVARNAPVVDVGAATQTDRRQRAMRRVLYVNASGDTLGGAERCLLDVVTRIGEFGWRAHVALPFHGELEKELTRAHVPTYVTELGVLRSRQELRSPKLVWRLFCTLPAAFALAQHIRRAGIDLVHSNSSAVLAGALAARLTGRPHVWHVREILRGPSWRILRRAVLRFSTRIVCISSAVARNVTAGSADACRKVAIIHDGVDVDFLSPGVDAAGRRERCRVAMIARVNPWKGHELFLRAARLALFAEPTTEFFAVGGHIPVYDGLRRRLEALSLELAIDEALTRTGHLDRRALKEFLSDVDVLVLPSTMPEPGGLVVLEGMAMARAVIATAHGGPLDLIDDGIDGVLVAPNDPAGLAEAIVELVRDPDLRMSLGRRARAKVEASFSLPSHVAALAATYDELLGPSRA